jgi:hypothetical protein
MIQQTEKEAVTGSRKAPVEHSNHKKLIFFEKSIHFLHRFSSFQKHSYIFGAYLQHREEG